MSKPLGIQLYTVRDILKDDFKGTVRQIAEMGYQGVEFAWNTGGLTPQELADFLGELGLKACGWHAPLEQALDASSDAYRYIKAIGCPYITTSLAGEVAKDWAAAIDNVAKAADVARSQGVTFTYHNHAQEFETLGGRLALDMLYEDTDPEIVKAELDTFWIKKGGSDPASYIAKYPGRVPQVHLKDMDPADGSMTEVGNGLIDLDAVYKAAEAVGAQWMIVEQDTCKGPSIESARKSINNLKARGFVD